MATTTAVTLAVCKAYMITTDSSQNSPRFLPANTAGGFNESIIRDAIEQMRVIISTGQNGYINGAAANLFMSGGVFST